MVNKFSIWLISTDTVQDYLSSLVKLLANKFNGPIFEPHLTLLGDISINEKEVMSNVELLVKKAKSLNLEFGEVSFSTTYFQSVFVRIKASVDLMNLNLHGKKLFNINPNVFMPHISLYYSNDEMERRKLIANSINIKEKFYKANKLILTYSTADPKGWKHLKEFNI